MKRRGDWMQTFTGRQFWPLDPRPEDIDIEDIAHALSNLCRFGGHCKAFYSVAEHSLYVERFSWRDRAGVRPIELARFALLHDAAEAYLVDVPRPIKRHLGGYEQAESLIEAAILTRFRCDPSAFERSIVKVIDRKMLWTEKRDLLSESPAEWGEPQGAGDGVGTGYDVKLDPPLVPATAERLFLEKAGDLGIR